MRSIRHWGEEIWALGMHQIPLSALTLRWQKKERGEIPGLDGSKVKYRHKSVVLSLFPKHLSNESCRPAVLRARRPPAVLPRESHGDRCSHTQCRQRFLLRTLSSSTMSQHCGYCCRAFLGATFSHSNDLSCDLQKVVRAKEVSTGAFSFPPLSLLSLFPLFQHAGATIWA